MAGVYGFKTENKIKVTYCKWDAQPCILGHHVLSFVARVGSAKQLKLIADRIILVAAEGFPSPNNIEKYGWYAGFEPETWRSRLQWTEGDLEPYRQDMRHMVDHGESLVTKSCNWAYVIDVDANNVVVYRNGNVVNCIPFLAITKGAVKKLVVDIERIGNPNHTA